MRTVPRTVLIFAVGVLALIATASGVIALDTGLQSTSDQETIYTNQNTSNYLSPPAEDSASETYETVGIDVASGVNTDAQSLRADHEVRTFEQDIDAAGSRERRTEIAEARMATILDRYQQLDRTHTTLFREYNDDQISSSQLLSRLSNLDTAVDSQVEYREAVIEYANPSDEFLQEFNSLQVAINAENSVTEQLQETRRGSSEPQTVYAMTAEDALVLATVDDGTFYRQATVLSERNLGGENQFDNRWGDATDRARGLYPWVFDVNNQQNLESTNFLAQTQVYTVTAQHTHGDIRLYFDGATTNVFHETQRKPLPIQPQTNEVFNGTDSLEMSVDLHGNAGPMRITLQDEDGFLIEDADIAVDEQSVGTTDSSGQHWTVRPAGPFEVTAETPDGEVVTVFVSAAA